MKKTLDNIYCISFTTLNVDGYLVSWAMTPFDLINEWWSEDCSLPANDDPVISCIYKGKNIEADCFEDIIHHFEDESD